MFATPISQLFAFPTCQCATLGHHICIFKCTQPPYSHRIKVRYKYLVLPLLVPKMIDLKVSIPSYLVGSDGQRHQINQGSSMQVIQNLYYSISFSFFSLSLSTLSPIHIFPKKLLVKPKHICVCDCYFY